MYEKSIKYDRITKDYAMYVNGDLQGYARSYHDAEIMLDEIVFDLLCDDIFLSADFKNETNAAADTQAA